MIIIALGVLVGLIVVVPAGLKANLPVRTLVSAGFSIGLASGGIVLALSELTSMSPLASVAAEAVIVVVAATALLLWRFTRDPERRPPVDVDVIVSPADGTVIYVKSVDNGMLAESEKRGKKYPLKDFLSSDLLQQSGTLIGIAMNFLDVHVNRSPITGRILSLHSIDGGYSSLRMATAPLLNSRKITVIDDGYCRFAVVQIASRRVRGIVSFKAVGDEVRRGDRIGAIRFGSQVDLFVPAASRAQIGVRIGQHVKAGLTIIAICVSAGCRDVPRPSLS